MPRTLDPQLKSALAERIRYYRELGIYDFYQRPVAGPTVESSQELQLESRDDMTPKSKAAVAVVEEDLAVAPKAEAGEKAA